MFSGAAFVAEMQHSSKSGFSNVCQFNTLVLTGAWAHSQWNGGWVGDECRSPLAIQAITCRQVSLLLLTIFKRLFQIHCVYRDFQNPCNTVLDLKAH